MKTTINQIKNIDLLKDLENDKIQIDDFEINGDELNYWFWSSYYTDELDDIVLSIPVKKIIEILEEENEKVKIENNQFFSLSNCYTWEDCYGNLEEEAEEEIIDRKEVLNAIYEAIMEN